MGPGGLPGEDPPRVEAVRVSARTRVTRLFLPDRTVIRKQPLGPDADLRLRHEVAMLRRLRGVGGVALLVDAPRYPGSIVLADAGRASLAELATPPALDELLGLATALARAVAEMHRRGVLHGDINPANIVLAADGDPTLVDFALATPVAEMRPGFTPPAEIVGTLAYLAPEATGRTGRAVDQRADLYALGATLYQLATGAPPFGDGDPLALVHAHLARVPVPPVERNPALPASLSQMIQHLLEKEPDRRYQTADGLAYDLQRLRDADAGRADPPRVGEHDVPQRLLPPSRLVGRDEEIAALQDAFDEMLAGRCRAVLVAGAPGVGKTALVDRLRPLVTGRDGWFLTGKFDQYRRDLEFDGVAQAFRALARLLLAEPEDELTAVRGRLRAALGASAGLAAAVLPELATLLEVPPDAGDPLTAQVRAQRNAVQTLRAVATAARPLVFFVDDLQWAGRTPLGLFDLVAGEEPIEGLLLVGAYRDDHIDATHPLAAGLARWGDHVDVRQLRLANLPAPALAGLVAETLRADRAAAQDLAGLIGPHTHGNPYETAELLDALRRAGLLTATADGWRWESVAVRGHLGEAEGAALSAARLEALPVSSRVQVEVMACLGGRVDLSVLQTATGHPAAAVEQTLAPALADGILIAEPGPQRAVRFRHDRLREAILAGLDLPRRRDLQLGLARRLAGVPELFAVAAEQYLAVAGAVDDPAERRSAVGLLRRAAAQAALTGDHARVTTLLSAAMPLVEPTDTATLIAVHSGRHAALFSLGRLEEADEEFLTIDRLCSSPVQRADATYAQVRSLTYRNRLAEATALGLASLRACGVDVPEPDRLPAELERQFTYLYRWLDNAQDATYVAGPEITDPTLLAATRLLNAALSAVYTADPSMYAWLSMEAVRIWLECGAARTLIGPASFAAVAVATRRGDLLAGYRAARRILNLGEAHGYEPDTSQARFIFAILACWTEPLEDSLEAARRAHEGLAAGGELAVAGYTYHLIAPILLDCAPTLDGFAEGVERGLGFVRRTGNEHTAQRLERYRWLAGSLRGARSASARAAEPDANAGNPLVLLDGHTNGAIAAAVFGDQDTLERHTAAALPLLVKNSASHTTATAQFLHGLALAGQARAGSTPRDEAPLSALDEVIQRLADRAADAPANFLHLMRLLEAERAWVVGDFRAAALAFDAARREVAKRQRPWHRALITEHAARFHLANGLDHAGYELLAQARELYGDWGATAKVAQLDWAHPSLGTGEAADRVPGRSAVTTGTLDLLGILSASQALSSETSLERLHARVVEVLGALTGATAVHLLLWDNDRRDWLPPAPASTVPAADSGHETAAPVAVLRYVQRTGEPLVLADATADDRFARDPSLADADCCALLAVPILSRGTLRAVLVLENRLLRGAFTADRLDAVTLIAGQLAVSLDNTRLYDQLTASRARIVAAGDTTRRRIERDLHDGAQQRLVSLALRLRAAQAGMPTEPAAELEEIIAELAGAQDELREIARGIHPTALANGGLRPALRTLARRSAVPVRLELHVDRRLPDPIELAAYYAVAEALTNTAKHARATVVDVEVGTGDGGLRIVVRDDGRGGADLAGGTGLLGLTDRIEALGGRMTLHSPRDAGTALTITLPLNDPTAADPNRRRS